jgi:hypothetical protein
MGHAMIAKCWKCSCLWMLAWGALACGFGPSKKHESKECCSSKAHKATSAGKAAAPASGSAAPTPANMKRGLLVALSEFEVGADGKMVSPPKPKPARLELLVRRDGKWETESVIDSDSNVFHKAMMYGAGDSQTLITAGGTQAVLKRWSATQTTRETGAKSSNAHAPRSWAAQTIWQKDFGGKFNRMRDIEVADLFNEGKLSIAIATHDQGVVAIARPHGAGFRVTEIDHQPNTFVHEIEIGDLNGDGELEVYATPSEPNKLDGAKQSGTVVRYVPIRKQGRTVVANLGERHAKEILVRDVDGDGRDELYVAVEGETLSENAGGGEVKTPVEIRRYDANTKPDAGVVVARIPDRLCRFLTVGDVDGDGKKEMVAAAFRSGLWWLRPASSPSEPWNVQPIDAQSSGFEHAALLADLDGDGKDELYVASDDQGELRRYTWNTKTQAWDKEVLLKRPVPMATMTWNLMTFAAN